MTAPSWTSFVRGTSSRWVVAHRGASSRHGESSPQAFEAANAAGAHAIETDVRRSADGVFICHHDETLRRVAGVDRAVRDLTFQQIQRLAPNHAPQLADVLRQLRGRCNLLLDLKLQETADIEAFVTLLQTLEADTTVAIGVRSLRTQAAIRHLAPELVQLALLEDPNEAERFVAAGGQWVRLWEHDASEGRIAAVHALGVPVLVMVGSRGTSFPIGEIDAPGVASLYGRGADAVMLNEPDIAIRLGNRQ